LRLPYWLVGRRIVEQEQQGAERAAYGERLLKRLARDLSGRFGRGFSERNLEQMRAFYLGWLISQTATTGFLSSQDAESKSHISQTVSAKLIGVSSEVAHSRFPLPWSHYARLLAARNPHARAFVGRQHRLRVGDEWYRVDLLLFHRRLRCLIIVDLKLGKLTHSDAGQMHLYLNYAREHWVLPGENPPVGLILCAERDHAVARYALEGLPNKVLAAEYRMTLPQESLLAEEIEKTRRHLGTRRRQTPQARRRTPARTLKSLPQRGHG